MDNNFHLAYQDKNSRVVLIPPRPLKRGIKRVTPNSLEVSSVRIQSGVCKLPATEETIARLCEQDPEVDLAEVGNILDISSRAFYQPEHKAVVYDFKIYQVICHPDGTEKERKPAQKRAANINHDTHPVKVGKIVPKQNVFEQFVIERIYQLCHDDGVTYEFLYNLAQMLEENQSVALLGAGPHGTGPLIFRENGRPSRCALTGETEGENYKLLLLLFGQELKLPEGFEE